MIRSFRRFLSRARTRRDLADVREQIAMAEDVLLSTQEHLQRLRERERRLQSQALLGMEPDQIVRQALSC